MCIIIIIKLIKKNENTTWKINMKKKRKLQHIWKFHQYCNKYTETFRTKTKENKQNKYIYIQII